MLKNKGQIASSKWDKSEKCFLSQADKLAEKNAEDSDKMNHVILVLCLRLIIFACFENNDTIKDTIVLCP
jgi:hypothetical protein